MERSQPSDPGRLEHSPGWLLGLITLGVLPARWVKATNRALGRGGAGFWFALDLTHFAHDELATRINQELAIRGSEQRISPLFCFVFTDFPILGASRKLNGGIAMILDASAVTGLSDGASRPRRQRGSPAGVLRRRHARRVGGCCSGSRRSSVLGDPAAPAPSLASAT